MVTTKRPETGTSAYRLQYRRTWRAEICGGSGIPCVLEENSKLRLLNFTYSRPAEMKFYIFDGIVC